MHAQTLLCLVPLLVSTAWAQQDNPFAPSPKQAALSRLAGIWEGSGTWRHAPDQPAQKWAGCTTAKSVLNGHFIDEDLVIDLGPTVPGPLRMRTFYGWERETQRYIAAEINNSGEIHYRPIHWEDKDTMTWSSSLVREGKLTTEHWTLTFGTDSYRIQGIQIVGTGKPFVHVDGIYKRIKAVPAAYRAPKDFCFAPVHPQVTAAHKMVGSYRIDGWMLPMPGAEKMPIGAEETIRPIFGGSVLMFDLNGDDSPMGSYQGVGAMAWSAHKQCFEQLFLSNMGELVIEDTRIVGNQMITTSSSMRSGEPILSRATAALDEDGKIKTLDVHVISGAGEPGKVFHANCKSINKKK